MEVASVSPPAPEQLSVGSKVRLIGTGEVGIIIHTWHDEFLDTTDCYVAFYGHDFPDGRPVEKPYVLRYLISSLEAVEPFRG
jgi:hypothetical protein